MSERRNGFRYISIAPGRVDGKHVKRLGKSVFLFDFLIDHQTDPDGRVNYGKPITYAWIEDRFPSAPPRRTLERWMATLRVGQYVKVRRLPFDHGMIISILAPKKWPTSRQLKLFPAEKPLQIPCGNTVGKLRNSQVSEPPEAAARHRQKWRGNSSSYEPREEKRYAASSGDVAVEREEFFQTLRKIAGRKTS
jgi:hypothetical protein